MEKEIKVGRIYKHFKGGYVLVIATAKHSDRDEIGVVYKGLNNGKIYNRPIESFVEMVKGGDSEELKPRFELATAEETAQVLSSVELACIDGMCAFLQREPSQKFNK